VTLNKFLNLGFNFLVVKSWEGWICILFLCSLPLFCNFPSSYSNLKSWRRLFSSNSF
jgi:hypothetical protein